MVLTSSKTARHSFGVLGSGNDRGIFGFACLEDLAGIGGRGFVGGDVGGL